MPKPQPANKVLVEPSVTPPAPLAGADIGINLIVSVLVAGAVGYGVDVWQGWAPWGMLTGGALGFAAWLRMLWRNLNP